MPGDATVIPGAMLFGVVFVKTGRYDGRSGQQGIKALEKRINGNRTKLDREA
jgi:hypothetical protein